MSKWLVVLQFSDNIVVEASNEEEAVDRALDEYPGAEAVLSVEELGD